MKKRIKNMWVKALREKKIGEQRVRQGQSWLRKSETKFCCLGVLCEIYRQDTGKGEWKIEYNDIFQFKQKRTYDVSFLPKSVVRWAGLSDTDPLSTSHSGTQTLSRMNDDGVEFDKIADFIEDYF